ncbi:MAG TPA: von Willebrand factor type A domain-containing protein [Polyangiaceae bacterium]
MMRQFLNTLYSTALAVATVAACDDGVNPQPAAPASGDEATGDTASTNGAAATGVSGGVTGTVGGNAPYGAVNGVAAATSSGSGGTGGGANAGAPIPGEEDDLAAAGAAGAGGSPGDPVTQGPPEVFATNPFVVARHDPLSTFAADVDTASYDAFRSYALSNLVPDPTRVRLEDFVNYFDYGYDAPASDGELPFSIELATAPNPYTSGTKLLRVGIQGKQAPPLERKPTNLVFLVDVSGSMQSPEKLPLVKQVLSETVGILNAQDTISIVTYAGSTGVRLPPTPVSNSELILAEINGLDASGSTAGAAGLDLAYQQAEAGFLEEGLNHIILCTDGDFNVGPSTTEELVERVEEQRRGGVTLTVLGFGAGNNDALMEGISNAGNGVYGNITDSEQASRYVEERLLTTLVHIAKDVKLQIEFNSSLVYAYRLLGYENRAIVDDEFRDDTVDAGEIGSGHRVTALYELSVDDGTIPAAVDAPDTQNGSAYTGAVEVDSEDWVLVKVRFKEPGASESDPAKEVALSLGAGALAGNLDESDADFRWAVAVAGVAELLKRSPYAPVNHLDTIEALLNDEAFADDPDKQEFIQLFQNVRAQLE